MGERITVLRHLPAPLRETMKPLCIGSSPRVRLQLCVAAFVLHHS